jgi:uncharacterized protein
MSISIYNATIPVYIRAFGVLTSILKKSQEYAKEKGIPEQQLLDTRLYEDMQPLLYQIQRASDTSKLSVVRLGGIENVPMEDSEKTFEDAYARIDKTVKIFESIDENSFNEQAKAKSEVEVIGKKFSSEDYLLKFAIPNFFFHVTTAYDILRHAGVPLGKKHYLSHITGAQ